MSFSNFIKQWGVILILCFFSTFGLIYFNEEAVIFFCILLFFFLLINSIRRKLLITYYLDMERLYTQCYYILQANIKCHEKILYYCTHFSDYNHIIKRNLYMFAAIYGMHRRYLIRKRFMEWAIWLIKCNFWTKNIMLLLTNYCFFYKKMYLNINIQKLDSNSNFFENINEQYTCFLYKNFFILFVEVNKFYKYYVG